MKSFSQRIGKTPVKSIIQVESMDDDLKNALWNILTTFYWEKTDDYISLNKEEIKILLSELWTEYFRKIKDEMPLRFSQYRKFIKHYFFKTQWFEVYDFIEFVVLTCSNKAVSSLFIHVCNYTLEKELSAYRFINGQITPITTAEEVESIEEALSVSDKFKPVKIHLERALELFSSRTTPDYRNSIKESISAVESYCSILTGDSKATLGQALKQIEKTHNIHSALKNSFSNLYGYTSNADGIRHALLEEENLKQEDAKFMLVSCSAFINYLKQKEANSIEN